MAHTPRAIRVDDKQIAQFAMLAGAGGVLAVQITAISTGLRGLLTQIHPVLEWAFLRSPIRLRAN